MAQRRSDKAAGVVRDRAPEWADEVSSLADTARDKASKGADEGRRRLREARS